MERNLVNIAVIAKEDLASYRDAKAEYGRGEQAWKIPLDKIVVREKFNHRIDFTGIRELADYLLAGGKVPPIEGDLVKVSNHTLFTGLDTLADANTVFVITAGERRYRAHLLLVSEGHTDFNVIQGFILPKEFTDKDRVIKSVASNNNKQFAPLELAQAFQDLREVYGMSNAEIAKATGHNTMHVSNQLRLAGITDEEKDLIRDGSVSSTAVLDMIKSGMAPGARLDAVKEAASGGGSGEEGGGKGKLKVKDVAVMDDLKVGLDKDETPDTIIKSLLIDIRMLNRLIGTDSKMSDITFKIENSIRGLKTLLAKQLPMTSDDSAPYSNSTEVDENGRDPLFVEAAKLIVFHQQGSTSLLQRKLKLGYNRANRIVDQLEKAKIIGPFEGSKAREVFIADEDSLQHFFIAEGLKGNMISKPVNSNDDDDDQPF